MNSQNWFFLRGLGRESGHWGDFLPLFQKTFPQARLIPLDLPGTGARFGEDSPTDTVAIARDLAAKARAVAPSESPNFLFALSLGGMVGAEWLSLEPQFFSGAVLVNSSLKGLSRFYERVSPSAWAQMLRIVTTPSLEDRERRILRLTTHRADWSEALLAERVAMAERHPMTRINFVRQLFAAAQAAPSRRENQVPVLVLNSLGDKLVHPRCSEKIAAKWGARLERHPWGGHDLPFDDAPWVVDTVRKWSESLIKA